jgi:glucokinase
VIGAVDIGATKTLVGLADSEGELQHDSVVRMITPSSPEAIVNAVVSTLRYLTGSAPLAAVGCAVPGPLDATRGIVHRLVNLDLVDVALGGMLAERLETGVLLEDDANCAALGEALHGAAKGIGVVGYLTVSTGIGAGIVIGGRILHGAHHNAGEIGHLVLDPAGPACSCGRSGDVESYAGGASLVRRALARWPVPLRADGSSAPRSVEDIFWAARSGDPDAQELVAEATDALASAVGALVATIDPGVVVMGGSIALGQPRLVPAVEAAARERVIAESSGVLSVVPAGLGIRSALAGAAVVGSIHAKRAAIAATPPPAGPLRA